MSPPLFFLLSSIPIPTTSLQTLKPHLKLQRLLLCSHHHHNRFAAQTPTSPPPQNHIPNPNLDRTNAISNATRLASQYLASGAAVAALHLLDKIPHPNVISWNLTLSCHNRLGQFRRTLAAFRAARAALGLAPNPFTYGSVLTACTACENVDFAEQVYCLALKDGFFSNAYICSGMIDLFARSGRLNDALKVFTVSDGVYVVCWNAVIAAAVRYGENSLALDIFRDMVSGFCVPNAFTFSSVLCACAAGAELGAGRAVHAQAIKCDPEYDVFVGTAVVDLYAKCSDLGSAMREFWRMPVRNVVSWTAAISGFVQMDKPVDALMLFKEMIWSGMVINKCTVTSILLSCSKALMVREAKQIHGMVMKTMLYSDCVVKESLISTYANLGDVQLSEKVFDEIGTVNNQSIWSAFISGVCRQSLIRSSELLSKMFYQGLRPNSKCCSVVVSCIDSIEFGRQMHSLIIKDGLVHDVLLGSALSTMYSICGAIEDSYKVFEQMQERDEVSWTKMIAGFATHGCSVEAFQLFRKMILEGIKPDHVALSAILSACNRQQFLLKGKEIHGHALRVSGDISFLSNSLVLMYSKCQALLLARRIFDETSCKDQVLWSSMICGYTTNGCTEEALSLFQHMLTTGFQIDNLISSSIIGVCGNLAKPLYGKQLHGYATKVGTVSDLSVSSALVKMYSKCGSIDDSHRVFDEIDSPDLVTWTAMIDGYGQHGSGLAALVIFQSMMEHGIKPDSVTLVSVLSACSRNGLVEEGLNHFNSMRTVYGIEPQPHHYACVVDLLGRSGRLEEARSFIENMPLKPDSLVWSTLLAACRVHCDVGFVKFVEKKIHEADCDSGSYTTLSNIAANIGDWEEVMRIRKSMKGMKKESGWSMV